MRDIDSLPLPEVSHPYSCAILYGAPHLDVKTSTTDFHLRASTTLPYTRRHHTAVCTTHELHSPETSGCGSAEHKHTHSSIEEPQTLSNRSREDGEAQENWRSALIAKPTDVHLPSSR